MSRRIGGGCGGLSKKQRQEATLTKLQGFKKGMSGGGSDGTEAASWKSQPLKFEAVHWEAESASQYDSHDPLKHGTDGGRSAAKISARAKVMQSMKGGFFEDDDEEAAARPREANKWQYDSHDPLKHGTDGGRSAA